MPRSLRRSLATVVSGVVLVAACGSSTEQPSGQAPARVASTGSEAGGERLPAADIVGLSTPDEVISLTDIEGPAVINLWATWCAPCRAEIPDFEEVHQARGAQVRFIGVNIGEDSGVAQEFLDEVGVSYDQFRDPDGSVSTALIATSMPTTVVIDADGVITERHRGPLDQDGLNEAIDEALGVASG